MFVCLFVCFVCLFQVSSYLPRESDDEHGDLWLIQYEDGDSEHFDPEEVGAITSLHLTYNLRLYSWHNTAAVLLLLPAGRLLHVEEEKRRRYCENVPA